MSFHGASGARYCDLAVSGPKFDCGRAAVGHLDAYPDDGGKVARFGYCSPDHRDQLAADLSADLWQVRDPLVVP